MIMDVHDLRSQFGSKYEGAIQQMIEDFWAAHR